jgi:TMEM175 potassium channel family protein
VNKSRLETFSDSVTAVIITIMVLGLRAPEGVDWSSLRPLWSPFLCYLLSFIYIGIYWNNHHHMLHVATRVNGNVLWANLHLLFWLSLVPLATSWLGNTSAAPVPTAFYGIVRFFGAVAYTVLTALLVREHGPKSTLAQAIGHDWKDKLSLALYAIAIPLALVERWISLGIYIVVTAIWLVPDSRIERAVNSRANDCEP